MSVYATDQRVPLPPQQGQKWNYHKYKLLNELYIQTEEAECEEDVADNEFVFEESLVGHYKYNSIN